MQNTFIHIGFQKTGSTFLQRQFFSKFEKFDYLSPPYTQHEEHWNKLQYGDGTQFEMQEFKNKFKSNYFSNDSLLISDEGLVGKPIYGGMQRTLICERLKQNFPDAKILIIIRGQFEMLKSLHNQWVKGARKGTKTFGDFLWYKKVEYDPKSSFTLKDMYFNTNEDYVHLDFLNYLELIKLYKSKFREVKVLPYELMISDFDAYMLEISKFLNVSLNQSELNNSKMNLSLSNIALAKKIAANSILKLPLTRLESKFLIERSVKTISKKNEAEYKSNFNSIKNYFKNSNSRLIELYPEIGIQNFQQYF